MNWMLRNHGYWQCGTYFLQTFFFFFFFFSILTPQFKYIIMFPIRSLINVIQIIHYFLERLKETNGILTTKNLTLEVGVLFLSSLFTCWQNILSANLQLIKNYRSVCISVRINQIDGKYSWFSLKSKTPERAHWKLKGCLWK